MQYEYLLFDLLILAGPFVLGFFRPTFFRGRSARAWIAVFLAALPFLLWDIAVTGKHWWFSDTYVMPYRIAGLPLEEWAFFAVVPYALIFSWEQLLKGGQSTPRPARAWIYAATLATLPAGIVLFFIGAQYSGLVLLALSAVALVDRQIGARVLQRPAVVPFAAIVAVTTLIFDGYLTGRPVVHYDEAYQVGWHLGTIPVEDFAYGFSSGLLALSLYTWLGAPNGIDRFIESRFGGYLHLAYTPDASDAARLDPNTPRKVAVIGGGIAGIRAASALAQRGFSVELFEKEHYIGGKIGAWEEVIDGQRLPVEHGFHAFFHHYYNLNAFLDELGLRKSFKTIEDYAILGQDGRSYGFDGVSKTPLLNLLSLLSTGMFAIEDVAFNPGTHRMQAFLEYHPEETFERFDDQSYAEFAEHARLPDSLKLIFNSFSRAFFAPADKMSMAELIKSFHFYFLGHDRGLGYDYPTRHYEACLLAPLRAHLEGLGVKIRLNHAVESLALTDQGVSVDGGEFDYLVLASDVVGTRRILESSPQLLATMPTLHAQLQSLQVSNPYAVLRIWTDRRAGDELPPFVITDKPKLLDSISFYHRIEDELRDWAADRDGGVYELHCYAIPDDFSESHADIEAQLIDDLYHYLPELRGMVIEHRIMHVRQNFTSLHVGQHQQRPTTQTQQPAIVLAGDWVKLPVPAMLMEGACTSGLYAANAVLAQEQVRGHEVLTIPRYGLLRQPPS